MTQLLSACHSECKWQDLRYNDAVIPYCVINSEKVQMKWLTFATNDLWLYSILEESVLAEECRRRSEVRNWDNEKWRRNAGVVDDGSRDDKLLVTFWWMTTPCFPNYRSPASCWPVPVAPAHSAPWWPVSPSSASCDDSETRSWSVVQWGRGRVPSQCASVWLGSGLCGTPSPARASDSECTSADHAVASLLLLLSLQWDKKKSVISLS